MLQNLSSAAVVIGALRVNEWRGTEVKIFSSHVPRPDLNSLKPVLMFCLLF